MRYLTRRVDFEASHRYWNPAFSLQENQKLFGKCVSPHGHGHNYVLRVTLSGNINQRTGMVINIKQLDHILKHLTAAFDHKFINLDHPAFLHIIPTTENIALNLYQSIQDELRHLLGTEHGYYSLVRVVLQEDPTLWAYVVNTEGQPMISLTKSFSFSAAHRLHSPILSAEENHRVFGKCNNLHGHGHNYELEVTVTGGVDPPTGMLIDLSVLMQIVQNEIIDRFDHKHLNQDTTEFSTLNPTGENIVKVVWDLLTPKLSGKLVKIGLWETPKTFFEYRGT
jgi:6-pyruvoyltetrahydropterin/6-carboxytetrahydropterin synthase